MNAVGSSKDIVENRVAMAYAVGHIDECKAAVYDLDNTLVNGRVAEGMGKSFLKREAKRWHFGTVIRGWREKKNVKRITSEYGEAQGLAYFFDVLRKVGCADVESAYRFARGYIEENTLPGARELVQHIAYRHKTKFPNILATIGTDIAAQEMARYLRSDLGKPEGVAFHIVRNPISVDTIGNPVRTEMRDEEKIIIGCSPVYRDGEQKLDAVKYLLDSHDLDISDCFVVGNDALDHPLMKAAKLSAAAPPADEETMQIANFWIRNYESFLKKLREISP